MDIAVFYAVSFACETGQHVAEPKASTYRPNLVLDSFALSGTRFFVYAERITPPGREGTLRPLAGGTRLRPVESHAPLGGRSRSHLLFFWSRVMLIIAAALAETD